MPSLEPKRTTSKGPVTCPVCGKVISRKADVSRHMKLHASGDELEALMHRCPFVGCKFKSLQKSNLNTHVRTHVKDRSKKCPDCNFQTCDPGSLTRHRRRLHEYLPKPRHGVSTGKDRTGKRSARVSPYCRETRSTSQDLTSLPSSSCEQKDFSFDATIIPTSEITNPWDLFLSVEGQLTYMAPKPPTPHSPDPNHLFPAVDSVALEEVVRPEYWAAIHAGTLGYGLDFVNAVTPAELVDTDYNLAATTAAFEQARPEFYWAEYVSPYATDSTVPIFPEQQQQQQSFQTYGIYNPMPEYTPGMCAPNFYSQQKPWSLDEYLHATETPATGIPLTASWNQLYAPPPAGTPMDNFSFLDFNDSLSPSSSPTSFFSPLSSVSSDEFSVTPVTPQDIEAFVQACCA